MKCLKDAGFRCEDRKYGQERDEGKWQNEEGKIWI